MSEERYPVRRFGPFKQRWYSICSAHYYHNPDCDLCQSGRFLNVWKTWIGAKIFDLAPQLWVKWANRG